ncbi:hypothetical protein [Streptomyces poonensis]|uniref:Uncharacterized protein n=1 Tax=Streptomyces poonensis TaxID=68255 RepID=A0A918UNN8_9ACTN|nr:hypothetical protein [Streptomyces poonensis]GGZ22987.1 hypothetical protein GCM10010365_49070 [Streptomyces poonensis]GLJ91891.1 hypothetical protein GCM10017589_44990 [Streptomyces poonensis]
MSLITTLARLEAVSTGRARPTATVRHRHLSERPLVFVPLTTAGEAGAPLGALVGTDRDAPRLLVVPQPRDRDLRFAFLAELADVVLPYVEAYADAVEAAERTETDPETGKRVKVEVDLCADAPQLIVPSRAGADFVRLLGRSMRFRRTAEQDPGTPHPAPPRVPLLGRWLTHFGERARVPGSSLLLALTDLLSRHWATGQSGVEDQHLGSLLAWIDPPAGESGDAAARRAELARDADGQLLCPPAGPATDPAFDNKLLAPAIEAYDRARTALAAAEDGAEADDRFGALTAAEQRIRDLVESRTRPTWDAVWHGIDLLRALPEGAHVPDRWTRDRWSFTAHRDRITAGEPPQPRVDDAVTAANKLAAREREQARLDAQEALDDPLVMAGRRLAGEAFAGEVTDVVMAYSEGRRPSPRPLVTVRTEDLPHLGERTKVYRSLEGKPQAAEFVAQEGDGDGGALLVLRVLDKMGRGKEPEPGSVPEKGDRVCFTLFEHDQRGGPKLPDPEETPWTHGGPPGDPDAVPQPDPLTEEDVL